MAVLGCLVAVGCPLEAQTDSRAAASLRQHGWFYNEVATRYSREEIQALDPWCHASWWPEATSTIGFPIWGLLWNQDNLLWQVIPDSVADRAGITEDNFRGILNGTGRVDLRRPSALETRQSITVVLSDSSRREISKKPWIPPTVWISGEKTIRIYSLETNSGGTWVQCQPIKAKVMDLRGCRGGSTEAALTILGTFLGPDREVATYHYFDEVGRKRSSSLRTPSSIAKLLEPGQWTVLVDRHTASSGELLAEALATYGARVSGGPTYGKHCIQSTFTFVDGAWIRFTVGCFGPLATDQTVADP